MSHVTSVTHKTLVNPGPVCQYTYMEITRTKSTTVPEVIYDGETLGIVLGGAKNKGDMLVYRGVPQDVYNGLIEAESPGGYFNRKIKGVYQQV